MGPHHLLEGIVGANRDVIGWLQPGTFSPPRVRRIEGRPPLPATFPSAVAIEGPQRAPPDEETGFLPAIQSGKQRMAVGLRAYSRGVPHGPACSGLELALPRGTEQVPIVDRRTPSIFLQDPGAPLFPLF